jgi:hypothetical protein
VSEELHVCLDRELPEDKLEEAAKAAITENPDNKPHGPAVLAAANQPPSFMALLTGKKWKPGRTLRVRFLGGVPAVCQKVEQVAHQWEKFANTHFKFGDDPAAEIRVAFQLGAGSWSFLGTDALTIPQGQPTMNYGWLTPTTPDDEYARVVLHEFGHALGCIHEHQNPSGGIHWNKERVYHDLMGPPNNWTKAQVDSNMFQRYSATITQFTAIDPTSIMMYSFPKAWTTDGFQAPMNRQLSEEDKKYIRKMYPAAS